MNILFWCLLPQLLIVTPFLLREPAFRGWVARRTKGRINWLYTMNEDFESLGIWRKHV